MSIPFVHCTDLYHPPQDPDDHFDLAIVMALPELDLHGVILDATKRFLERSPQGVDIPRDPGVVPVTQLNYLTARSIPFAVGPTQPLMRVDDTVCDRLKSEQAGVELLSKILETSQEPVTISIVGSARVVAAAYNRNPELMHRKTKAILLNAGANAFGQNEWNVGLDRFAFIQLWRSGLPIFWYPCATENGAFDENHPNSTHWSATHEELLHDISPRLRAWFCYALSGSSRGDIIHALDELGKGAVWEHLLPAKRHLWSTASLVMAAGRILARTNAGWRFVLKEDPSILEEWPFSMENISPSVNDVGEVTWKLTDYRTNYKLFHRRQGSGYRQAMAEALNALFQTYKF
ncbi:MAG: hypothetical protein V1799_18915 [bacterium]